MYFMNICTWKPEDEKRSPGHESKMAMAGRGKGSLSSLRIFRADERLTLLILTAKGLIKSR